MNNQIENNFIQISLKLFLVGLLVALIVSIIILSAVPPVSRDALTHHLAVPKLYLKHGGIYEIPELKHSYYPMNLDLLYLIPLSLGNDIIPKFIHFAFALMTAWLIFSYLKKRVDIFYALSGVLLFLSIPIIIKLSITAYVDLGLIYFSTATIIYFLKWVETDFKIKYLIISAIFCGLALGTKYSGLIIFCLITLFVTFIYSRLSERKKSNQFKSLWFGAVFVFVVLIVFSPWIIRNYIWTGNPVYPLYKNWFSTKSDVSESKSAAIAQSPDGTGKKSSIKVKKTKADWGVFTVRKVIYDESWWEIALIPIRIFFQGKDNNPKYFDGRLNPLLILFPIFIFINFKKDQSIIKIEKKVWILFSFLYLSITFFQAAMRIRYIGPIIPPLIILSAFSLHELFTVIKNKYSGHTKVIFNGCVFIFVAFLVSLNVFYIIGQFRIIQPMSYISGRVERNEYIEKYRPEYTAVNYANHNIPEDAKILCMFIGNRSYYSDREVVFSHSLASKAVIQKASPERIFIDLKDRKITHLLIRYDLFNKWTQDSYKSREREVIWQFFKKYVKLQYSKNGHGLYQLKNHTVK